MNNYETTLERAQGLVGKSITTGLCGMLQVWPLASTLFFMSVLFFLFCVLVLHTGQKRCWRVTDPLVLPLQSDEICKPLQPISNYRPLKSQCHERPKREVGYKYHLLDAKGQTHPHLHTDS